ncbi:MAG: S41 family peptidase [Thermodesulfobacteriota bacterium]
MDRKNRYGKLLWVFFWLILIVLVVQGDLPSGGTASGREAYQTLKVFSDVLAIVQRDYVKSVDSKELVYGAIKGMLGELDPHSSFMTPDMFKEVQAETKGEFGGLGIEITIKDGVLTVVSPFEGTPAFEAGIKPEDQIVKIEGVSSKGITLFEAVHKLRGRKGTKVTISIMRKAFSEPKEFTLTRALIEIQSVKTKILDNGLGYLRLSQFQERSSQDLRDKLLALEQENGGNLRGLVLDLRNNPGGLLDQAVEVSDEFIDSGLIVFTEGRRADAKVRFSASRNQRRHDYPMVVLVNGGSASASEIVAGALQDHRRAVILGTKTFGKGSVQTITPLEDGSGLRLTTAHYFTPSGRTIHDTGLIPDIVVAESPERITGNVEDDPQLARAVELLRGWSIFGKSPLKGS